MNGAAAHLIRKGEEIIIMGFELSDRPVVAKQILVDADNRYLRDLGPETPATTLASASRPPTVSTPSST
jgi:aspartate 1-decarboxylase